MDFLAQGESSHKGGTGTRFGHVVLILTGVSALMASFITLMLVISVKYALVQVHLLTKLLIQLNMATIVRLPNDALTIPIICISKINTLRYRKNYRKPLLQRYVIRMLLMYVQPLPGSGDVMGPIRARVGGFSTLINLEVLVQEAICL